VVAQQAYPFLDSVAIQLASYNTMLHTAIMMSRIATKLIRPSIVSRAGRPAVARFSNGNISITVSNTTTRGPGTIPLQSGTRTYRLASNILSLYCIVL
jgi:hypothetical protein